MRERPAWQFEANCVGLDPAIFYPAPHDVMGEARAKAICSECPVVAPCLLQAVADKEPGVWGQTSEADRRKLTKRRKPGRPMSVAL